MKWVKDAHEAMDALAGFIEHLEKKVDETMPSVDELVVENTRLLAALSKAMDTLANWPLGGNTSGQLNMMRFAADVLAELETRQASAAQPEPMPESERTVLAYYGNSIARSNRRSIRAEYIAPRTKLVDDGWCWDFPADYDEATGHSYWPAGWYECVDKWDELSHLGVVGGELSAWMPLPPAPAKQEGDDEY